MSDPRLNSVRVVVTNPDSEQDGTQHESRQTFENVLVGPDGYMLLYSKRPPQDAFNFGLPIGQDDRFQQVHHIRLAHPSERSITEDRKEDGLCTYCQLLLLDDAPEYTAHQPCMGLLIQNWGRCELCRLINISIGRNNPHWKARYEAGEMDIASPDTRIWIRSKKLERHSLVVATMGVQPNPTVRGTPIIWATSKSLGSLTNRMIWKSIYTSTPRDASARLDVIKEWLEECLSKHTACSQLSSNRDKLPTLPTRLLKISPRQNRKNDEIPFIIQLYEPSDGERERENAPYIALSHCWGESGGPLRTTRSNIAQHREEIAFEALPLSFRDVVAKAWYLGIMYLWIDSLCIIQDDSSDWEAEAARMAAVYSNATLTFAVTEAADPSQGCCPQYTRAFPIPLQDDRQLALIRFQDHLNLDSRKAALNRRGWTFQEAALSKRMVCFDNDQLLWKCCTRHESEDGLLVVSSEEAASTKTTSSKWNIWACLPKLRRDKGHAASYAFWYEMMEDYSNRKFTFEKDKLPALAGIVEAFQGEGDEDAPLLGLWRGDLVNGFLWRPCEPGSRPASYHGVVPSWSWISVSGTVTWQPSLFSIRPASDNGDGQLEVISARVSWTGLPMTSAVEQTTLMVKGRLKRATMRKNQFVYLYQTNESSRPSLDSCASGDGGLQERTADVEKQPELLGYCQLDLVESMPEAQDTTVWCLEVCQGLQWRDTAAPRNFVHRVLLLQPVDDSKTDSGSEFKRVGVGIMWQHSYRKNGQGEEIQVRETFSNVPRCTISLL